MAKCEHCGKNISLINKKYYIYPSKTKGSLEITQANIICKDCVSKHLPDSDETKYNKRLNLVMLIFEKKFKEALEVLNSVFEKENESDWYSKGNILLNLEQPDEALECYDEALFIDTHYIKAWYRKGSVLLSMNKYMESAKCFENVIKLEGGDKTDRKLTGWGFPAMFCCMIAWICLNNELVSKDQFSKEVYEITGNWVNKCHSLLTSSLPLYEDENENGNLKYVNLASPELDQTQFVDYCLANFDTILESIEPQVVTEIRSFEYYEKER